MFEGIASWVANTVIPALVGSGAGVVTAAILARRFIDHNLGKAADRYRAELGERTEALKVQLGIRAYEHQIALSRVDAQRAESISRVHAGLRAWAKPTIRIVVGCPIVNATVRDELTYYRDCAEEAHAAAIALADIAADNSLYLPSETYDRICEVVNRSMTITGRFLRLLRLAEAEGAHPESLMPQVNDERRKLDKIFHEEIQPLHQDLTSEFRQLLRTAGVAHV